MNEELVNIFYVEDNRGDVQLLKLAFERANFHARLDVAEDGVSALEFLRKQGRYTKAASPDLILLDLNVPKKGGLSVLQEIRKDSQLQNIPVFILTSSDRPEDKKGCLKMGADRFIVKPTDFLKLIELAGYGQDFLIHETVIS